jgi:hypothetical protein
MSEMMNSGTNPYCSANQRTRKALPLTLSRGLSIDWYKLGYVLALFLPDCTMKKTATGPLWKFKDCHLPIMLHEV